jgi:hypothetical protein
LQPFETQRGKPEKEGRLQEKKDAKKFGFRFGKEGRVG